MTQDQNNAINHWSRFGEDGFPVVKRGRQWWISVHPSSCWYVVTVGCPTPFPTKRKALDWFNDLCISRFREWRGIAA
jgi:hypothetical protein